MPFALFTYGSLELPPVMEAVIGARLIGRPCAIDGHLRRLLEGEVYPGLIEAVGESTSGTLYEGVDDTLLAVFDEFESDHYERRRVSVRVEWSGEVEAWAYVVPASRAHQLSNQQWNRDEFARVHLDSFLAMCRRFRQSVLVDAKGSEGSGPSGGVR